MSFMNFSRKKSPPAIRAAVAAVRGMEPLEARRLLAGDGLTGKYYDNSDFTNLMLTRVDPQVSFGWYKNAPISSMGVDNFSVRWTGQVKAPTTGQYTFSTWSGDGVRLYVNNQLIVNDWNAHAPKQDFAAPISMTAGQMYDVQVDYYSGTNSAEIAVGLQYTSTGAWMLPDFYSTTGPDTTAPSVPTGLKSTSQNQNSIGLSWTASTDDVGVAGYNIYRNGVLAGTSSTTSYTDNGLSTGTAYSYTVAAYDAAANTSAATSPLVVSTTAPDTTAPSIPTGLKSTSQTNNSIALSWTAATDNVGVTGYNIYRNGILAGTSATTSFTDSGLSAGTAYSYTVAAYDAAANTSGATSPLVVSTTAPDTTAPSTPTGLKSTSQTNNSIALSWTAATDDVGVTGYNIYRNGTLAGTSATTSFTDTGLSAGTTYNYTVAAYDAAANTSSPSAALPVSTTAGDTTAPSAPTGLKSTGQTSSTISLSWTAATDNVGVTGYNIYRNGTLAGTSATTTFTDSGLAASTSYTYTVKAFDAAANLSAASTAVPVSTSAATAQAGLLGEYYDNTDFTNLKLTRVDQQIDFGWYSKAPASSMGVDDFSIRWTGQLVAQTSGKFTLSTWSGDGVRVWFNGALIIDDWGNHAPKQDYASPITFTAGQKYSVRVDYYSDVSSAEIALGMQNASGQWVDPVYQTGYVDTFAPSTPLYPAAEATTDTSALISWAAANDDTAVSSYALYRNGVKVGETAGTSLLDTGLTAGTNYTYTVRALDANGNASAASTGLAVQTLSASVAKSLYQAEDANAISGGIASGGSVGSLNTGDYLKFSGVNLGNNTPTFQVYASVPLAQAGGVLEVHLDSATGPLVGSLTLQPTGSGAAPAYVLQHGSLSGATGIHDVYVTVKSGVSVANIDWVRFSPKKLTRVMPIGDSITQGPGGFDSYRYWLYKELEAQGYAVDFVGSLQSNYAYNTSTQPLNYDFDQDNEGHAGWRADQILANITQYAQAAQPDIALIHLGTNDIFQSQTNASTATEIGQIIDALRAVNPNIKIALAQIIPSTASNTTTTDLNSRLSTLASQKTTAASPVLITNMYTGFSTSMTIDGTHPNAAGAQFMADHWTATLLQLLDSGN